MSCADADHKSLPDAVRMGRPGVWDMANDQGRDVFCEAMLLLAFPDTPAPSARPWRTSVEFSCCE